MSDNQKHQKESEIRCAKFFIDVINKKYSRNLYLGTDEVQASSVDINLIDKDTKETFKCQFARMDDQICRNGAENTKIFDKSDIPFLVTRSAGSSNSVRGIINQKEKKKYSDAMEIILIIYSDIYVSNTTEEFFTSEIKKYEFDKKTSFRGIYFVGLPEIQTPPFVYCIKNIFLENYFRIYA